ncbi:plasmid partitioning protein RepB [Falsochrobactrum shanghaiense]|uniref:Plasmid partitioning protein RepB n=1 Tax=Falsochrobactrum shanghaiense TaxID=2201899 RepID=A0A316J4E1_9HYPH|nr:plasmid partitioning protein RepB [Falsochrobactrum shanghaiense]PWL16544.1 plasmid partitioning protein RepB [Falsochrobactrum shanghaiense]
MSRKDTISNLFLQKRELPTPPKSVDQDRVRTGAIGAMGASLKELAESAKQANDLQKQLEEADAILEIEPRLIDPSRIADRISIDVDPAFDRLVESIRENGQQVPILLRPHPDNASRFQIAYGRRRLRAAQALGIKVRAIVRKLTDNELIVAQGRENLDRQDLSFIEKAFFAKNLEDEGTERAVIISALDMDKSDVSRLISIARKAPVSLIRIIGSASKAGRKRWMELLEHLENEKKLEAAQSLLNSADMKSLDSDQRFTRLISALRQIKSDALDADSNNMDYSAAKSWQSKDSSITLIMNQKPKLVEIQLKNKNARPFSDWLSSRLDTLYDEFERTKEEKSGD